MTKGVLLFCFDNKDTQYHKILEKCVYLIKKNLKLEITVVTNHDTFKKCKPLGFINYNGTMLTGIEHMNCRLTIQHWLWI
jgi:hypothetical protein